MALSKGTRISNTVEFFSPAERDIGTTTTVHVGMLLGELITVIKNALPAPGLSFNNNVILAAKRLRRLMCRDTNGNQVFPLGNGRNTTRNVTPPPQLILDVDVRRKSSRNIAQIGVIVRRRFSDGYHEGKVTRFNPNDRTYNVKYQNGDREELTYDKLQTF